MKILLLSLFLAVPACAQTTSPTPVVPAKFDWKLRLTKGQRWTQTYESNGTMTQGSLSSPAEHRTRYAVRQTLVLRNEVLFVNSDSLVLRATFLRFEQITSINNGQVHTPDRSKFTRGYVGVPFKIKRALDGHVLAVSGLEALVTSGRKLLDSGVKSKPEHEKLSRFLLSPETFRDVLNSYLSFPLPASALSVGQAMAHKSNVSPSFLFGDKFNIYRTLRSFDGKVARFDERGSFKIADVQTEVEDGSKTYLSSTGRLSGQTQVDALTGLPRCDVTVLEDSKTFNAKRARLESHEEEHVVVSMKLEP